MQTELPINPPTDTGNPIASQAFSPKQRWIVLGMWVGLLLFGTVALWPVQYGDNPIWSVVIFNVWLNLGGLAALWAGLAWQPPLAGRFPQVLGFVVVFMVTCLWVHSRSEDNLPFLNTVPLLPAVFLVLFPPLSLVRWLLGWRIGLPEERGPIAQRTTIQSSLRQLLIWTGFTAILLAWAKCVPSDEGVFREGWQSHVVAVLWFAAMLGGLYLTILLPSVGLMLARRNRGRFALGTLAGISLLTLGILYFTVGLSHFDWPEDALPFVVLESSLLGPLFGTLVVLRFCGYRLLRCNQEGNMPTELPTVSPTDAGNRPVSRVLPPVQRWIVLGMWIGLLLFATVALYPASPDEHYWYMAWVGTCLAQACLPVVWVALARQLLGVHLPGALMLEAVLMVTIAWTSWRSTNDLDSTLGNTAATLVSGPVLLALLALLRWLVGWRIDLEHAPADQRPIQFSLRQLLMWMGITAVLLAWATSVLPNRTSLQEAWQECDAFGGIIFGTVFGVLCLPILLTLVGFVLGRRHRIGFALGALAGASLFIPGSLFFTSGSGASDWDEILMLAVSEGSFLGVFLGTLLVLRLCGYRLLRHKEERLAAQSPANVASEPTTKLPRLWETPFPYVVGAMLLVGGLLCWPAWKLEAARRVSAMQWEFQHVGLILDIEEGHITGVGGYPTLAVSNAGLEKLQKLRTTPTFQTLDLFWSMLADDQVHYLCGLATLRSLSLSGTRITDAGLAQLSGLDNLQYLCLDSTQVTDAGLKHLMQFTNLESLSLARTDITGAGLAQLSGLRLSDLNLESTRVTDASLAHLAKLPNLQVLVLAQTSITDAGMVHLAQLTNLEELHLAGTKVTDAGLNRLRSLKKLRTLDKGPTTAARLEEFRRAMPQCEIKPDDWRPQEK
jgi:hypothetical protein